VAKLTAAGTAVVYATYLGGSASEAGAGIAVDETDQAYVTGSTASADFPTQNALDPTLGGPQDAFVTRLSADGTALSYSTYLGGSGSETGAAMAVDGTGPASLTGVTASTDFPTLEALDTTLGGAEDAFVTRLNAGGTALVYSTYLGGSGSEAGTDIAVAEGGLAYVIGWTESTDFLVQNALQPTFGGGISDAFVTQMAVAPLTLSKSRAPEPVEAPSNAALGADAGNVLAPMALTPGCYGHTDRPHNSRHQQGSINVVARTVCPGRRVHVSTNLYRSRWYGWQRKGSGSKNGFGRVQTNAAESARDCDGTHDYLATSYHEASGAGWARTSNRANRLTC
jgi:hypothetical protein